MEKVYFVKYTERLREHIKRSKVKRTLCYVSAIIINLVTLIEILNGISIVISSKIAIACVACTIYKLWITEYEMSLPEFEESSLVTVNFNNVNSENFEIEFTDSGYMIFDIKEE